MISRCGRPFNSYANICSRRAQASSHIRFRRAVSAGSVALAKLCAREMRHLELNDALELVLLYASQRDGKFDRAACRWLGRLATERHDLSLAQLHLAAAALATVQADPDAATATLRSVTSSRP